MPVTYWYTKYYIILSHNSFPGDTPVVNCCITNSLILEVFYVNYTGTQEGEREKPSNIYLQSIMTRKLALWEGLYVFN